MERQVVGELESITNRIAFYKRIPVYPEFVSLKTQKISDVFAPICQGDRDDVSFVDSESKRSYLKKLYEQKKKAERKEK